MMARRPIEFGLLLLPLVLATAALLLLQIVLHTQEPELDLRLVAVFGVCLIAMHIALATRLGAADQEILPIVAMLSALGLIAVVRLEPSLASRQLLWVALGSVAAMVTALGVPRIEWLGRYRYTW